jgi:hypothetical protein
MPYIQQSFLYQSAITIEEDALDIVNIFQTSMETDENKSTNNKTQYKQVIHFLICD